MPNDISAPVKHTAEVDVAIVGAGCAGLGAAAALREAGLRAVVLEAGSRVGGRAHTVHLCGEVFDRGASWLHAAERNPLADIARAVGEPVTDSDRLRGRRHTWVGDRPATDAEAAAFDAAWGRFEQITAARAAEPGDCSVAEALAPLRADPWCATVETWEAAQIAAADPRRLSLRDLHANQLEGANYEVDAGLGQFVARHLAARADDIRLDTPVSRILWRRAGGGVVLETPAGRLSARACIVTVSTGVLAAGGIAFDPPLPEATQAAIDGLPMGLLSKVVLRSPDGDHFGLPGYCGLARRVEQPWDPNVSFLAWPMGRDHIVGFLGGHTAWSFAGSDPRAVEDFVRAQLRRLIGADAERRLVAADATTWGSDKLFLGAYAYAVPGAAAARGILAAPLDDGRLAFAGEAVCTDGLAGTVGGAWNSGRAAAYAAATALAHVPA